MHRYLLRGLLVSALSTLVAACTPGFGGKPAEPEMTATTLTGVGHLGGMTGIPRYFVNGRWGGNVPGWGGGGGSICCIQLPAEIPSTPYIVKVQWRTCDVSHIEFVDDKAIDPNAKCVPSEHEASVPVHYALLSGRGGSGLKIHFLPGNRVEAWYTTIYPESNRYPGPAYSRGPAPDYAPVVDTSSEVKPQGGQ